MGEDFLVIFHGQDSTVSICTLLDLLRSLVYTTNDRVVL